MFDRHYKTLGWASSLLTLAACGGGDPSASLEKSDDTDRFALVADAAPQKLGQTILARSLHKPHSMVSVQSIELAQTHVLPLNGKTWVMTGATESIHFVGQRSALALVKLSKPYPVSPVLQGWLNGTLVGEVALNLPSALPRTEAGGVAYATDRHSAVVPATWMRSGLQLSVRSASLGSSRLQAVSVGADMPVNLRILPFYLYGADDSDMPFAQASGPDATTINELFAKWPVSALNVGQHPAQRVNWPYLVLPPDGTNAAYIANNKDEEKVQSSPAVSLGTVLGTLGDLMRANGESGQNVQYYAPTIMQNAAGAYRGPSGGLGSVGGDTGAGDASYAGVFVHEQGHSMDLSHAGEAYDANKYPYLWGSLAGSSWGYDAIRNEFLPPFMPVTASRYSGCASQTFGGHARAIDAQGRCVKQDPMQSGSGDQDPSYKFATFSDASTGIMQRHMESSYVVPDAPRASGYKLWDRTAMRWTTYTPATTSYAQNGLLGNFPVQKDVPVTSIALTISKAGTVGATQIYPTFSYTGNLIQQIDPTDAIQRTAINPLASWSKDVPWRWYCINSGCDYTVKVTYEGGTVRHVLLQGAFRAFNDPDGALRTGATDPLQSASFKRFVINVPNDAVITRIELLDTPSAWKGLSASPAVLACRGTGC